MTELAELVMALLIIAIFCLYFGYILWRKPFDVREYTKYTMPPTNGARKTKRFTNDG